MAASFEIQAIRRVDGAPARVITVISQFAALEYVLVENAIGALVLTIPDTGEWPEDLFWRDTELYVYRSEYNRRNLEGDKPWFVRDIENVLTPQGEFLISITAYDAKHLLSRRIVAYVAGSAQAIKTAVAADDAIKAIVRENMGNLAAVDRQFTDFGVDANTTSADVITKAFAWRNVLDVLQEIAAFSFTGATFFVYISFDCVVESQGGAFTFKTFLYQRGTDHGLGTQQPLIFSAESGSLTSVSLEKLTADEATVAIVGGVDEGQDRLTTTVVTSEVYDSPFNYIEMFADARNGTRSGNTLTAEGAAQLATRSARYIFKASVQQTDQLKYNVHYKWGDIVTAQFAGLTIDGCHIDQVRVRVTADAGEEIEIDLATVRDVI